MSNEKLLELLTLIGSVKSNKWDHVMQIVELMPSITVMDKGWHDRFRQDHPDYYPLDLSKLETWSTSPRECVDLAFRNKEGNLICYANIYDSDTFDGHRLRLRFTATLVMPIDFIKELKEKILYGLDGYVEDSYEEYLEKQKETWMSNLQSEILGTTDFKSQLLGMSK